MKQKPQKRGRIDPVFTQLRAARVLADNAVAYAGQLKQQLDRERFRDHTTEAFANMAKSDRNVKDMLQMCTAEAMRELGAALGRHLGREVSNPVLVKQLEFVQTTAKTALADYARFEVSQNIYSQYHQFVIHVPAFSRAFRIPRF